MQTVHWILPVFLLFSILTSHDFSWLQKGQLNMMSRGSMFFFLGPGVRLDFLRPMMTDRKTETRSRIEKKTDFEFNLDLALVRFWVWRFARLRSAPALFSSLCCQECQLYSGFRAESATYFYFIKILTKQNLHP
jgi:hypothetical protein